MPDSPQLYTLDTARKLVRREQCAKAGHEIERHRAAAVNGRNVYDFYTCGECDVTITMTYPPLEGV